MKNNPFVVEGAWKAYDVLMFSSEYKKVFYDVLGTDIRAQKAIVPKFHITLRNKLHPELIIRTRTATGVYEVLRKDGKIGYYTDTANYTWELFDQTHKCWNKFGTYNYPTVYLPKITELYDSKLLELKRKFHQKASHWRVQKVLKDFMDEYIINEITKDILPSVEMLMGYDLKNLKK